MTDRDWTFGGTWPFRPRWFDTTDGRLHYIDEGEGPPVVFMHGNPSWSYLHRKLIGPLVGSGHRVIAFDHLGFGRSDKPDRAGIYAISEHARRSGALLDSLTLRDVTLVLHDWGGPIGLDWAVRHASNMRALVVINAFCHPPSPGVDVPLPLPLRLFRIPGLGPLLVQGFRLVTKAFLFKGGVHRPENMQGVVRQAYLAPHPTWASRAASLAFARQFPATANEPAARFQQEVRRSLPALRSLPVLVAWGDHDTMFGPSARDAWKRDFPNARVVRFPDAGHFVQEDAPEALSEELLRFLQTHHPKTTALPEPLHDHAPI
jgi:pimeloyl-ACP methyl ester carboxylesterase